MSHRRPLVRVLALGSLGSALFYSNYVTNSRPSACVSVSAPFLDSLSWPWRPLTELAPTFNPALVFPNHVFRPRPVPLSLSSHPFSNAEKEASEGDMDGSVHVAGINTGASRDARSPKCFCNCLGRDTIANAATKVGPAVVHISVPKVLYGMPLGKIGSGTIIDADGTILTCAHFVADSYGLSTLSKGQVDVTLQDGRRYKGTVVNADLLSDIAIVKITSKTPLPTATLGCSSKLRPGDWVAALGCPLTLQNTVTAGIVSCVDRKSSDLGLGGFRREYLQTDCPINEGNSGGPLVNMDGELIGVNVMKVQGAQGLSFAVPVDAVCKIIEHFKTNGRVVRPWLGLKMIDLNEMIAAQLKEKDAAFSYMTNGVLVPMVTPGSPAERAGFLPGDIVIEFDGKCIGSMKEIIDILGDRIGKPLKVVVIRANQITVTLTVIPEEASPDI